MMTQPTFDDATRFLIDIAKHPRRESYPNYGYEIYIPNIVHCYRKEINQDTEHGHLGSGPAAERVSAIFYDAAWWLCRRGVLRPGIRHIGGQSTSDGCNGYSLTTWGREWLKQINEDAFVPAEPGRFSQLMARFRDRLGEGYFSRSQEAIRCHFATAYLACCAMCGAAAESIIICIAIEKDGDEDRILRMYKAARGRQNLENFIVGQLRNSLAHQFHNLMDLLKYWRDEAAHGEPSDISEFEAYEAMARLLRLAHFVDDHWEELTSR
jgi:hypothetical protein